MNKEATMSFVWHVFRALMKRLKLFKISFLSFNMEEIVRIYGFKQEGGGELFIRDFRKL